MTRGGIYGKIEHEPEGNTEVEPDGFSEGSGYFSPSIPTRVIIQTLSISKNYTSSIVLPGWAILEELIFCIVLEARPIFFNICPAQLGVYYPVFAQLGEYWKIIYKQASNTEEFKFNIIILSN